MSLAQSATNLPKADGQAGPDIRQRVLYLMLFRLVLISLVLGITILLAWLSDFDLSAPNSLALFVIIGFTYLMTIIYAVALQRGVDPIRLADVQVAFDLLITSSLVHVTGGAQSAYTFFFPLSIIGAATVRFRVGAVVVAIVSFVSFVSISLLGYWEVLPSLAGQRVLPHKITGVELGRALALNSAAFAGVAVLAYNLGTQVQSTFESLEVERSAAADLFALHEDIVRSLSSGLITADTNDVVVTINQAACEILGVTSRQVLNERIDAVLPGVGEKIAGLDDRSTLSRADLSVVRADESELKLGLSISPLRDNDDHVIGRILNFQDLTELRAMEAQVRNAERLATIGTLAAGVAHEIRNPLASISGSIELLSASPQADEDQRTLMGIVTREIDRLNRMIKDLLDYTNPRPRKTVEFDLTELAGETCRVFEQDGNFEGVSVALDASDSVVVTADPEKLRQVLWNLLRNAGEAVKDGRGSHVDVEIRTATETAMIVVSDDGPGIASDDLKHLFDPFFTTKSTGSGLGLATCQSIITEHGGSIDVDSPSQPGGGTRFVVRLPMHSAIKPGHSTDSIRVLDA